MERATLTIINKLGLHARAAAKFVQVAAGFSAEITVDSGKREVNGKSIMGVMMLAVGKGSSIDIIAAGDDAKEAIGALTALINDRFGEDE